MTALSTRPDDETLAARLRWAVADAATVAGRDVAHWRRQPAAVLVGALFPVLLLLMFVYLLGGGMVVPGGGDYRDFLVPGMLALAMVFGVEATMTAVVTDTARGITDRFRSLPMAPSAVVAGRCLADMASSVVGLAVLVAAALAIGWRPAGLGPALAAVGLLLLLRLAFLWIGIYLGLLTRDPADGHGRADPGVAVRLPVQRVRRGVRDARVAGDRRGVEPGRGHGDRRPRAVRRPRWAPAAAGRPSTRCCSPSSGRWCSRSCSRCSASAGSRRSPARRRRSAVHRPVDGGPAGPTVPGGPPAPQQARVHDDDTGRARAPGDGDQTEPAVRVRGWSSATEGGPSSTASTSTCARGEVLRAARPERRRQDDDDRDPRGCPEAGRRRRAGAGRGPGRRRPRLAGPHRRGQPGRGRRPRPSPSGRSSTTSPVYHARRDRPAELIAAVGLEEKAGTRVGRLSGGQRRRLAVALGVQGRPGARLPRRADHRAWTRSPAGSSGS